MKKILCVLTIILIAALLAACGGDETDAYADNQAEAYDPQPTPPQIVIHTQENPPTGAGATTTTDGELVIVPPTREELLTDLDMLVRYLEHTFPHHGVVYRRFGVNFLENAANLREQIESPDFEPDWHDFRVALMNNFFFHPDISFPVANIAINSQMPFPQNMAAWIETGMWWFEPDEPPYTPPPVEVSILEEGRIGYIRLYDFALDGMGAAGNAARIVSDFILEIADFEHLIIDIRDAGGGTPNLWENVLIAPNLQEEITQYFHAFTMNHTRNTLALYNLRQVLGGGGTWQRTAQTDIMTFTEMPELPYLDTAIAAYFTEGFTFGRTIGPDMAQFGAVPFAGQMWLLIDDEVGGAAAMFASLMHFADVATLVGEPVGGNTSMLAWAQNPQMNFVTLPDAGMTFFYNFVYITDHLGRAIDEYVTRPHVYNMDGMDALETVLVLINQ